MRKKFRIIVSSIPAVFLALLAALAIYTAETVVDELGYTSAVRSVANRGWVTMTEIGYVELVWWGVLLFSGGAISLWIDHFLRPTNAFAKTKVKIESRTIGKVFRNTQIHLDGKSYERCEFNNVTFVYDGGMFELLHNKILGCTVKTNILETENFVKLIAELGFISVPFHSESGVVEFTGIKREFARGLD